MGHRHSTYPWRWTCGPRRCQRFNRICRTTAFERRRPISPPTICGPGRTAHCSLIWSPPDVLALDPCRRAPLTWALLPLCPPTSSTLNPMQSRPGCHSAGTRLANKVRRVDPIGTERSSSATLKSAGCMCACLRASHLFVVIVPSRCWRNSDPPW